MVERFHVHLPLPKVGKTEDPEGFGSSFSAFCPMQQSSLLTSNNHFMLYPLRGTVGSRFSPTSDPWWCLPHHPGAFWVPILPKPWLFPLVFPRAKGSEGLARSWMQLY